MERSTKYTLTVFCAAVVFAAVACTATPKSLPPGQYSHTESSTNSAGTTTKQQTDTNVYYDQYGNKRAVQETETTKDPKGLMNKKTTTTTKSY